MASPPSPLAGTSCQQTKGRNGLRKIRIVFTAVAACQDPADRVARLEKYAPIQSKWIIKETNTETAYLSITSKDVANSR